MHANYIAYVYVCFDILCHVLCNIDVKICSSNLPTIRLHTSDSSHFATISIFEFVFGNLWSRIVEDRVFEHTKYH